MRKTLSGVVLFREESSAGYCIHILNWCIQNYTCKIQFEWKRAFIVVIYFRIMFVDCKMSSLHLRINHFSLWSRSCTQKDPYGKRRVWDLDRSRNDAALPMVNWERSYQVQLHKQRGLRNVHNQVQYAFLNSTLTHHPNPKWKI